MEITPANLEVSRLKRILQNHAPTPTRLAAPRRPAAVLVGFYPDPAHGMSLVFTKRTGHLNHHGGQISFPGGGREKADQTLEQTALREAWEEIGLRPHDVEPWGRLGDLPTVGSPFVVTPVTGLIPFPYEFKLNAYEVERLIIAPLAHLMDPANFFTSVKELGGLKYQAHEYKVGDDIIWGATARILANLISLITRGREGGENWPLLGRAAGQT